MSRSEQRPHLVRLVSVTIVVLSVSTAPMLGLVALTGPASAATITVDDSGGADYENLQWALDNATAGDVIEVADGTYSVPAGGGDGFVVDEDVTIRGDTSGAAAGAGAAAPRIRGSSYALILTENASGATIEGLELHPITDNAGIRLDLPAGETLSDVAIRNNTFADLASDDEVGIDGTAIDGNLSSIEIADNRFEGSGSGARYGVHILDDEDDSSSATGTTYANVTIADNEFESLYYAVDIEHTSIAGVITDLAVTGNDVSPGSGEASNGVEVTHVGTLTTVSGVTIADNQIDVDFDPLVILGTSETSFEDVLVEDNTLEGSRVRLDSGGTNSTFSRLQVAGNTINATSGSAPGLSVTAGRGASTGMDEVVICDNTITAVNDGISLNYGSTISGVGTDIHVVNNTVESTGASGDGLQITSGHRTENLTIAGNTFGASGTVGANGIFLSISADGGTTRNVAVLGNEIRSDNQHGIYGSFSHPDGEVDGVTISHNDVRVENGQDGEGVRLFLTGTSFGPVMDVTDVDVFHNNVTSRAEAVNLLTSSVVTADPVNVSTNRLAVETADHSGILVDDEGTLGTDAEVDLRNNEVDGLSSYAVLVATSPSLATEVSLVGNDLRNNDAGLFVDENANGSFVSATGNNIAGNVYGIKNNGAGTVTATGNWWGASDGPSSDSTSGLDYVDPNDMTVLANGTGDSVSNATGSLIANVAFAPYNTSAFSPDLYDPTAPIPTVSCPTVTLGAETGEPNPPSTPTPSPPTTPSPTPTANPQATAGSGSGSSPQLDPAAFELSALTVDTDSILTGESVTVTATVTNVGERSGTHQVTLGLDGTGVRVTSVTLDGGNAETVTLTHTFDVAGEYALDLDGQAVATVTVVDPTPTASPSATSAAPPTTSPSQGSPPSPAASPTETPGQPGFTLVMAVVALAATAMLARRRR